MLPAAPVLAARRALGPLGALPPARFDPPACPARAPLGGVPFRTGLGRSARRAGRAVPAWLPRLAACLRRRHSCHSPLPPHGSQAHPPPTTARWRGYSRPLAAFRARAGNERGAWAGSLCSGGSAAIGARACGALDYSKNADGRRPSSGTGGVREPSACLWKAKGSASRRGTRISWPRHAEDRIMRRRGRSGEDFVWWNSRSNNPAEPCSLHRAEA